MKQLTKTNAKLPVLTGRNYQNPLTIVKPDAIPAAAPGAKTNPDPYVLKYNGLYFCYSSGASAVPVLQSENLVDWRYRGEALVEPGHQSYWAPAAIYHNGVFYMYYSSLPEGEADDHFHFLKVATADNPLGPFIYQKTLFDTFSIDAHVVQDAAGGFQLYYSGNAYWGSDSRRPGTVILVDRLLDMLTPEGKPRLVVRPTLDAEIFARNRFGDGRDWHTIEGAFFLSRKDRNYLMYSGNAYTHPRYFVGYAVSAGDGSWDKQPDAATYYPLLCRNRAVEGTGHNSFVKAPNNVDDWIVYHGRDAGVAPAGIEQRTMRIDPLLWRGNDLWTSGPSSARQDAPALPSFRDLFLPRESNLPSAEWQNLRGNWTIDNGTVRQNDRTCVAALVNRSEYENFILEISLEGIRHHMGGVYGVYAGFQDAANNIQVLLDAGKRRLMAFAVRNGVKTDELTADLDPDFNFHCFHSLKIIKTGAFLQIFLDERQRLTVSFLFSKGRIGMVTYYSGACFAGVAVTEHLEFNRDNQNEFLKYAAVADAPDDPGLTWAIKNGALGYDGKAGEIPKMLSLKEPPFEDFQLSMDFAAAIGPEDGFEFYPLYQDDGRYLKIALYSREVLWESQDTTDHRTVVAGQLAEGFDFGRLHTFWVRKYRRHIVVFLDEYLIYQGEPDLTGTIGVASNCPVRIERLAFTRII